MKSIFRELFLRLLSRRRVSRLITSNLVRIIGTNEKQVVHQFREPILKEIFEYPSIINDGYLHIQRTCAILHNYNLNGLRIIDVGAAGGETCIMFAKAFPSSKIMGFEPISSTFSRAQTTTRNFSNIELHNSALGELEGSTEINIMSRITASSLLSSQAGSTFNGQKYFEVESKEMIKVNKLDNFISSNTPVALIKIDVQGFELEVMKGAINTLKNTRFVLVEMQNHEIYVGAPKYFHLDEFLRSSNFELFDLIPSIRERGQVKEFDALYVNKAFVL